MAARGEAVYCTLLMTDNYLPGAAVLAHSLRNNGTKGRLVALFTPETLKELTINELKTLYDEVIPVRRFTNGTPENLYLMDRPDLISTFTKIELWRQTQFDRIVYIDSDVVAVRAPDELLSLDVDFAAAPDVGWPDIFNSGVMVLRPNIQDYYSLRALAERGISFDGGDQGLLNTHFKNWHRLSFTYNCTPNGNYQYLPAYKHFESTISLLHFIGPQKPWNLSRYAFPRGTPYDQLLGRWWAVYDRHYRPQPPPSQISQLDESAGVPKFNNTSEIGAPIHTTLEASPSQSSIVQQPPSISSAGPTLPHYQESEQVAEDLQVVQRSLVPEALVEPGPVHDLPTELVHAKPVSSPTMSHEPRISSAPEKSHTDVPSVVPLYVRGEEHVSVSAHSPSRQPGAPPTLQTSLSYGQKQEEPYHYRLKSEKDAFHLTQKPPSPTQRPFSPPKAEWDATREPPPRHSKPEAIGLQKKIYNMSEDTKLFRPPSSYPEAPKNMYYEVPSVKREPQKLAQIFPWEARAVKPTRVFADEDVTVTVTVTEPGSVSSLGSTTDDTSCTQPSTASSSVSSVQSQVPPPGDIWKSYSAQSNAWDDIPEIRVYIEAVKEQWLRRGGRSNGDGRRAISDSGGEESESGCCKTTTTTNEANRSSLPGTPAPVRKISEATTTTGTGTATTRKSLSAAEEGVPNQESESDWVGVTVDMFLHLLRAVYSYWELTTESSGPAGRAPTATMTTITTIGQASIRKRTDGAWVPRDRDRSAGLRGAARVGVRARTLRQEGLT
ncbi:Glycogenin [Rasamsonia emersonii CBS 393.64]|uniref:glycogenin glucosyltransferase n=1 Tax=Rasamsonia emersonii (strain ATCC 16479 / CBS 393.64 / IMI 116815) TaxID=1408163 RepID=A0A0F4YN10_RASE3|nr:Glycogenin [Rasamsonia emersonii CBS 393.64]KKA19226.1 Glycogenin [Rasamsonia emersonii CBS 393.64]